MFEQMLCALTRTNHIGSRKKMLIALLALTLLTKPGEPTPNENAAEFKALCDIIRLAEQADKIEISAATAQGLKAYKEIVNLNNSAADDSWRKDRSGELSGTAATNSDEARQKWRQQIAKLGEKLPNSDVNKYTNLTNQPRRPGLAKALSRQLDYAAKVKTAMTTAAGTIETTTQEAKDALKDALYGQGKRAFDGTGLGNDATATCKTSSTAAAGKSLTTDLMCHCLGVEADGIKNCKQYLSNSQASNWGTHATIKIEGEKALRACQEADGELKPTADRLSAAVATFQALIGKQAAKA
uniref:Variant surface glycoprotein 1125.1532 n=1 Tax=Trypanosoma brucei TaxID=5691 RepID=A0A1J0R779_9TRYP|nr:variant surface glycoprotein 1125.1532 [Trypanosoma brucei]